MPEINLTPQLIDRVLKALPGVATAVLHQARGGRTQSRLASRAFGARRLIIGTRLAVFAPATNLGLIVIDEEHDGSCKQNESPRHHARDVAIVRAGRPTFPSAASDTKSGDLAQRVTRRRRGGRRCLPIHRIARARDGGAPSSLRLVPARGRRVKAGCRKRSLTASQYRLQRGEQSLCWSTAVVCACAVLPALGWSAPRAAMPR